MFITLEVSARHLHLSHGDLASLFGADYQLQVKRHLSQPGQFAATDSVTLIGPKGSLSARIVGPTRPRSQVELSLSDCRHLGLAAPLRLSGDLDNTPGITLAGPQAQIILSSGLIVPLRHLHLDSASAKQHNLQDRQIIRVKISGPRAAILDQVTVRVEPHSQVALHLDADEANALGLDEHNHQAELLL